MRCLAFFNPWRYRPVPATEIILAPIPSPSKSIRSSLSALGGNNREHTAAVFLAVTSPDPGTGSKRKSTHRVHHHQPRYDARHIHWLSNKSPNLSEFPKTKSNSIQQLTSRHPCISSTVASSLNFTPVINKQSNRIKKGVSTVRVVGQTNDGQTWNSHFTRNAFAHALIAKVTYHLERDWKLGARMNRPTLSLQWKGVKGDNVRWYGGVKLVSPVLSSCCFCLLCYFLCGVDEGCGRALCVRGSVRFWTTNREKRKK